jgi:TonB family protein
MRPHIFTNSFLLPALIGCALAISSAAGGSVDAQQRSPSQELYETAARHHQAGSYKEALQTIEELLKSDSAYAPAWLLKTKALIGLFMKVPPPRPDEINVPQARRARKIQQAKLLKEAADSLERFLQLEPDTERAESLREQLASLRVYAEPAIKDEAEWTVFSPIEVTEKAQIRHRPEPRYPEEARAARLNGTVKLLMVLAADGTVKHILVLQSPHRALTESAIEAARNIRFEPAVKDGRPVSTATSVEYHFQTY